ncbi:predicted protein [Histoplasma capsulatum G186AR]|uniref:Uncharacterized protein n=1 Tax=Ajellomyces capsulatus (strain G186AR / H82 / ATCC MYA-2454 / RMSCC 2432) TaxID=447093 RepID=C0NL97_AJECG|nr:uncharacterized protein HCBG_03927 [Histoplasma capsulatum G186AR]EEH08638.1 predicted protein [Histoplasma capsulatum G186AR]
MHTQGLPLDPLNSERSGVLNGQCNTREDEERGRGLTGDGVGGGWWWWVEGGVIWEWMGEWGRDEVVVVEMPILVGVDGGGSEGVREGVGGGWWVVSGCLGGLAGNKSSSNQQHQQSQQSQQRGPYEGGKIGGGMKEQATRACTVFLGLGSNDVGGAAPQ